MEHLTNRVEGFKNNGYTIIDNFYTNDEVSAIIAEINKVNHTSSTFRKTDDLFAIRRIFKEIPTVKHLVFNHKLKNVIDEFVGLDYFIVKSIYFDKPEKSNWFVARHQDLTISVDKKADLSGYGPWTLKPNQFAVQPPIEILKSNFTIRIHLDDTDEENGALKVIPGSHLKDIYRAENIDWNIETESFCSVKCGGIMFMRPLLMHASNRTTTNKKRRVIHIEFSKSTLPSPINWSEKDFF